MFRLKDWQIKVYGIASVFYILEYIFLLLTMPPQTYKYSVLDNIYFQWQCLVYLLLFISIFHSFRHQSKPDRTVVFGALAVSIIRFVTQALEGLQFINAGNPKVVMFNFFVLVLSVLIYVFKEKIVLWYRKLR